MKSKILMVVMLATLPSCKFFARAASTPESWVRADRATFEVVAPDYTMYIEMDPSLPPLEKKAKIEMLRSWSVRIRAAEKTVEDIEK